VFITDPEDIEVSWWHFCH